MEEEEEEEEEEEGGEEEACGGGTLACVVVSLVGPDIDSTRGRFACLSSAPVECCIPGTVTRAVQRRFCRTLSQRARTAELSAKQAYARMR